MSFDRRLIEAKLALDLIPSADMPQLAWDALEAGLDGAAIRTLAALENPTYFQVSEVLPRFMEEVGLSKLPIGEAALLLATRAAHGILKGGDDPLVHVRDFESLWVRAQYAKEIRDLGTLYDDVWIAQATGQSEARIREWVRARLKDFVTDPRTR